MLCAVLGVRAGGQLIATNECPFHRDGEWVAANKLQVGDRLLCADCTTITVEGIRDTGDWQTVTNYRARASSAASQRTLLSSSSNRDQNQTYSLECWRRLVTCPYNRPPGRCRQLSRLPVHRCQGL